MNYFIYDNILYLVAKAELRYHFITFTNDLLVVMDDSILLYLSDG